MNRTDSIVQLIGQEITGKDILEVACGTAEFSLSAARRAGQVVCIDIDDRRLNSQVEERENVHFRKMDAAGMDFDEETFDTIVLYNALYHVKEQYDAVMAECRRVLRPEGKILLIATWKLDCSLMEEMFAGSVERLGAACLVKLGREGWTE